MRFLYRRLATQFPGLSIKLQQAGMFEDAESFIHRTLITAFYMTTAIVLVIAALLSKQKEFLLIVIVAAPLLFLLMFMYFIKLPDVILLRMQREIDKEIVFAGRFLVIELQSGIPLYDAFINIAKNYPSTGKYFAEIVHQVDLGTPMEDALNEAVELTPSSNFRKFLWQIVNSLKTGSDITTSLTAAIDQIQKSQVIEIKKYGRKLNPLAMFYMMIAVIAPTLGITMLVVLSSFVSLQLNLTTLLLIAAALGFMQFMFLAVIKSSRPAVDV
jgi:flagellar protein FlaJ